MIDQLRAVLSFLTIIPSKKGYDIDYIALNIHLFPFVGLIIGFIVGVISLLLSYILDPLIVAFIAIALIFLITGGHHTDALADFADGLMARGKDARKVMKDPSVGSIGASALILYFIGSILALYSSTQLQLFITIIVSEVLAKYSMVLLAYLGRPAWEGLGAIFLNVSKGRLALASIITIITIYLIGSYQAFYALSISIITVFIILYISNRRFNGVSGDVFGACNEITRLSCFILLSNFRLDMLLLSIV